MWTCVTGGAGYIGSHVVTLLLEHDKKVIICDNFCNSHPNVINRILQITNKPDHLKVYNVDLLDYERLVKVFTENHIDSVIHLAGLKAVGESVREPVQYYHNNILICCNVLRAMRQFNVVTIIHSSSATVYGHPTNNDAALVETDSLLSRPLSPYGHSKSFQEQIIMDAHRAGHLNRACILRYFNPVGAHPTGLIGEHPAGPPNNLMPAIAQAAVSGHATVCIFGDDYPTRDGTGIRDYIHVMDLARGHLAALSHVTAFEKPFLDTFNLGTGRGHSVKQVIDCFERVSGVSVTRKVVGRRAGDVPVLVASVDKASNVLQFKCEHDLVDMCTDHWRWQQMNPHGYQSQPPSHDCQ